METIISAILALLGSIVGTFGGILASNKLTNYKIEQLEKRVNEHNNLIKRTYEVEKKIAVIESELEERKQEK